MTSNSYFQITFYVVTLLALAKPLGWYMARVYEGESGGFEPVIGAGRKIDISPKRRESERGDALDGLRRRFAGI